MKANTELRILKLCEGLTICQAQRRLDIMAKYCENKKLALRINLVNISIGE